MNTLVIRNQLLGIFEFRKQVLKDLFVGEFEGDSTIKMELSEIQTAG